MIIAEVSKRYDITADTIRYYERIGLLPVIPRTENGIRQFDEESCKWIEFIKCMRNAGMEIEILLEYVELFKKGSSTVLARKKLLEEQRIKLIEKQNNINATIQRLDYKLELYDEIIAGKREDFSEKI